MSLTKRQAEMAEIRMAEALGRPVRRCESCGELDAHWVPEGLDERDLVVPGRYSCAPIPAVSTESGLDIEGLDG